MRNVTYPIWATALLLYLLFLGWHENWRGPLTQDEIENFQAISTPLKHCRPTSNKPLPISCARIMVVSFLWSILAPTIAVRLPIRIAAK